MYVYLKCFIGGIWLFIEMKEYVQERLVELHDEI